MKFLSSLATPLSGRSCAAELDDRPGCDGVVAEDWIDVDLRIGG